MSTNNQDVDSQGDDRSQNPSQQEEFDFSILFDYNYNIPLLPSEDESARLPHGISPSSGEKYTHSDASSYGVRSFSSLACTSESMDRYGHPDNEPKCYMDPPKPLQQAMSPRIEITPSPIDLMYALSNSQGRDAEFLGEHHPSSTTSPRFTLPVPGLENCVYRETPLSPASSGSSTSFVSEQSFSPYSSPGVSPKNSTNEELCPQFQGIPAHFSPRTSPVVSPRTSITEETHLDPRSTSPHPRSRSSSPGGKRRFSCTEPYNTQSTSPFHSRTPSPQHWSHISPREESSSLSQFSTSPSNTDTVDTFTTDCYGIPMKIGKSSPDPSPVPSMTTAMPSHILSSVEYLHLASYEHEKKERKMKPNTEPVIVMQHAWPKQIPNYSSIPITSLPSLEWQLESHSGPYELQIEVQPKPHHRAHYETEGSRGAVKAAAGGHPVVQLHGYMENKPLMLQIFIGTADERILKPHAFYQVHRITGKTVTTTSYEKIIRSTKVLEIPLEPKNNMKAVIDCAGILKLRNADIELRKGETDIGRKNTRVRLVFRVHIPEASGRIVSLQVASTPIECSQRSAHELPMVENQTIDSCSVFGGQQMILTGQNFTADSKVLFIEKAPDGQQVWEVEATVDKDKSQSNLLFVEVPEYRNKSLRAPVKVNFYVINGKRKKSQPQHFTYHPQPVPSIKTEPIDDYESSTHYSPVIGCLGTVSQPYYSMQALGQVNPTSCLVSGIGSCQQVQLGLSPSDSQYQQLSQAPALYPISKCLSPSQAGFQPPLLTASPPHTLVDPHRSVLVPVCSPGQSSIMMHHHSPTNHQSSPVIQFSPTNQQLKPDRYQEYHHIMYCENFTPSATRPPQSQIHHSQKRSPSQYPTVIQQQPSIQRVAKNGPPPTEQKGALPTGVIIKQEQKQLDQAYLDDEGRSPIK
ncbi:nuclear factor of activated T-cells, cytoplasmic 2 isoform X2 [Protopterus annectens]|uniref:nuclear factor of activated T-cells, cytoplasmic 2 isoform X2 n=1 Tax=Protopterus annectens TaxID=7888 RepID=UPI001CFAA8A9|nr:nuclear factor of activated T-cells, cytoplasmic 2 isoform X2 [Protopterus annectens]